MGRTNLRCVVVAAWLGAAVLAGCGRPVEGGPLGATAPRSVRVERLLSPYGPLLHDLDGVRAVEVDTASGADERAMTRRPQGVDRQIGSHAVVALGPPWSRDRVRALAKVLTTPASVDPAGRLGSETGAPSRRLGPMFLLASGETRLFLRVLEEGRGLALWDGVHRESRIALSEEGRHAVEEVVAWER
jgi:hypothetical protein